LSIVILLIVILLIVILLIVIVLIVTLLCVIQLNFVVQLEEEHSSVQTTFTSHRLRSSGTKIGVIRLNVMVPLEQEHSPFKTNFDFGPSFRKLPVKTLFFIIC
jgi:hypothetical protein